MRNQKGASVIEVLIVVAIIGIIAAIAIPSLYQEKERQRGMADFKVYFGVTLPAGELESHQKAVLRPFVKKRLAELSADSRRDYDALAALYKLPPAQDAAEAQARLDAVTKADIANNDSLAILKRAEFAAKLRGLYLEQ